MTNYRRNELRVIAVLLFTGALIAQQPPQPAPAGPQLLHPMFQDHAVLQRDRPIKIYGEAAPRADVKATLGTASINTRAGADGTWSATLPAMPADVSCSSRVFHSPHCGHFPAHVGWACPQFIQT